METTPGIIRTTTQIRMKSDVASINSVSWKSTGQVTFWVLLFEQLNTNVTTINTDSIVIILKFLYSFFWQKITFFGIGITACLAEGLPLLWEHSPPPKQFPRVSLIQKCDCRTPNAKNALLKDDYYCNLGYMCIYVFSVIFTVAVNWSDIKKNVYTKYWAR